MTVPRIVGLLLALAAIGIAVVAIRVDQAASYWRIQEMQFRETELRRQIWAQEMEMARLRSPRLVQERAIAAQAAGERVESSK